jgi:hypothetical protein
LLFNNYVLKREKFFLLRTFSVLLFKNIVQSIGVRLSYGSYSNAAQTWFVYQQAIATAGLFAPTISVSPGFVVCVLAFFSQAANGPDDRRFAKQVLNH